MSGDVEILLSKEQAEVLVKLMRMGMKISRLQALKARRQDMPAMAFSASAHHVSAVINAQIALQR